MPNEARLHPLRSGLVTKPGVAAACAATTVCGVLAWAALPPVVFPPANPFSESKRVLGKVLFWDEQLSSHNTVSCGTCHVPSQGGGDPRLARSPGNDLLLNTSDDVLGSFGVLKADAARDFQRDGVFGVTRQITGRSANSVINAALVPELFWDGRATAQFRDPITNVVLIPNFGALESQTVQPPLSDVEMGHTGIDWSSITTKLARVNPLDLATNLPPDVSVALASRPSYPDMFQAAFGDPQITPARIAMAIATYERTLISDQAPIDRYRAGELTALGDAELRGQTAFTSAAGRCSVCHSFTVGTFTDTTFRNIGLRPPAEDPGRQTITGLIADRGKFKVPGLRNVGLKQRFMHNGMFTSLTDVVGFYARAPGAPAGFTDNRDPIIAQIALPSQQQADIVAFLTNALTDPRVRDETFPFDRPTLVADRAANMPVLLGGGTAGSSGVPVMIAVDPPMVGSEEFRFGVDGVPAGASARLGLSANPPVNGLISPDRFLVAVNANSAGTATVHWPLTNGIVSAGQVLYAQWFVADPAAAGGESGSDVAQVTFFCGLYGCPPVCPGDYTHDGSIDGDDVIAFFSDWDAGLIAADLSGDGGVDGDDVIFFFGRWDAGC
ncbi:MAG: cytochrome c peroxidase [Phycisphaerales bacterium]